MRRLSKAFKDAFRKDAAEGAEHRGRDAKVVVGPVIGKVTSSTARVLLEVDRSCKVAMALVLLDPSPSSLASAPRRRRRSRMSHGSRGGGAAGGGPVAARVEKEMRGGRAAAFEFSGLLPGSSYGVVLDGCSRGDLICGRFRTFLLPGDERAAAQRPLRVAVVSCNKIFVTQQEIPPLSDLWADLAKRVEGGAVDLVVHLGDQVYGDGDRVQDKAAATRDEWSDRFRLCSELLRHKPPPEWAAMQEEVCEKYRQVYRETWGHPATARCLAACPNLMIYDDHEIRDNWADLEGDRNPDKADFFIARCAWQVYNEYQRQLYQDLPADSSSIDSDHHFHVIGGIGLMFLDVRGCRSFHCDSNHDQQQLPYLGERQWRDIDSALSPHGGLFSDVQLLLVCSPAPLVFLQPGITNIAGHNVPRLVDFLGHWSADRHLAEQTRMIRSLAEWKLGPAAAAATGRREVLVLGGDVHCGGHSQILKDGSVIINHLTTSAIANRPLPKPAYLFMRAAGRLGKLEAGYSFRHHHWTSSRNYGLLTIRHYTNSDPGKVEVQSQLIIAKRVVGVIKSGKAISNTYISTVRCGCFEAEHA